jgi:flagella basal body P-ring formation protein FlgA
MKKVIFIAAVIFFMNFAPRVFANQFIPGGQFEAMAVAEIERILEERGETRRHEINLVRQLADVSLPNGVIDIKLSIPSGTVNYVGVTPVRARVSIGGKVYRDVNFVVEVKIYDYLIIANHDLQIEVPVSESDFRLAEIPVDGRGDYVKDITEVKGLVPQRIIRAGSPVSAIYFRQPVVVNNGTPVKIVVHYKGIEAMAKGFAMTRGRIGEVIKVKNESSQKIISAKVIDSGTVEVTTI